MYVIQFNGPKVIPYADPRQFEKRVKRFLSLREGENTYFLGCLPEIVSGGPAPGLGCFTVEEDNSVVAAGAFKNESLVMTWASHDMFDVIATYAVNSKWRIRSICAPAHVAYYVGKAYADRTGQRVEIDRGERIYQLARSTFVLPEQGRLEAATPADRGLVRQWVEGFVSEANFEAGPRSVDQLTDGLLTQRILYLWKSPQPVAMAAWVSPTPNGASINFVYTPPEYRGQGYGKAVSAALGAQMLASGLKYCFILTDLADQRTNALYQAIGARTLCEFLRCTIRPGVAAAKHPHRPQECGV